MARMGKDGQGWARMALKAKGLKALNPCQELTLKLVATHPQVSIIVKLRQRSGKDGKDGKDGQGWPLR